MVFKNSANHYFKKIISKYISDHNEFLEKLDLLNLNCNNKDLFEKDIAESKPHISRSMENTKILQQG